jgi:hypothetical protein
MLMTDLQLIEAENAAILRRRDGLPRLKKALQKKKRPRVPAVVEANTAAADGTGSVSATEHKLSEVLAKIRTGHRVVPSAATRVLVEERLTPRRPDGLAAAHALVAERLQPSVRIAPETVKLVEQVRAKVDGRTVFASGEDLNAKMRALVTR